MIYGNNLRPAHLSGAWDLMLLQLIISLLYWVQLSLKMVNVQNMWKIEYENVVNHSIVCQIVGWRSLEPPLMLSVIYGTQYV